MPKKCEQKRQKENAEGRPFKYYLPIERRRLETRGLKVLHSVFEPRKFGRPLSIKLQLKKINVFVFLQYSMGGGGTMHKEIKPLGFLSPGPLCQLS